jgi:PleD family two-component response regulator
MSSWMIVKVLIVDDQPQLGNPLANLLQRGGGFNITEASSGQEALDLSRNRPIESTF